MTIKKVYAVLFPDGTSRLFQAWADCRKAVHGIKGVHFKGFPSRDEAEDWLAGIKSGQSSPEPEQEWARDPGLPQAVHLYVDGAYRPGCKRAGWAWVAIREGRKVAEEAGVTEADALSRNIDGELEAAIRAMAWAFGQGFKGVVFHDYSGIAMWATGAWKVKAPVSKAYVERISTLKAHFTFRKVAAHTGDVWNEYVDKLAESAITTFKKMGSPK